MTIFQRRLAHDHVAGMHVDYELKNVVADGWTPAVLPMAGELTDRDILFEKASIDESFFDLSLYVRKQLLLRFPALDIRKELENISKDEQTQRLDSVLPPVPAHMQDDLRIRTWKVFGAWWPEAENVDEDSSISLTWVDLAHAIAAERMISMRQHIKAELGYTTYVRCANLSSAGIASNKTLAKVCIGYLLSFVPLFANHAARRCCFRALLPHFWRLCRTEKSDSWEANLVQISRLNGTLRV